MDFYARPLDLVFGRCATEETVHASASSLIS